MDIAKAYFIIDYYLRLRRAIITVILYKEGKVDYLLLGSYCPIALKNTLSKILERVIVDYIVDIIIVYCLTSDTDPTWPTQTTPSQGGKLVYLQEEKPCSWVRGGKTL